MIDNLHFFNDIHISRYKRLARFLSVLFNFISAVKKTKWLFFVFLSAISLFSFSTNSAIRDMTGKGYAIAVFLLSFILSLSLSFEIAKRLSYKHSFRFDIGIRDSWVFISTIYLSALYYVPIIRNKGFIGYIISVLSVITATGVLYLLYLKFIAPKKQPDLDIPYALDADIIDEFLIGIGKIECKKIQIKGESRDAILLKPADEIVLRIPNHAKRIKFAVGIKEVYTGDIIQGFIIEVLQKGDGAAEDMLFSKYLHPADDNISRGWIDVDIEPKKPIEKNRLVIRTSLPGKKQLSLSCRPVCFSLPRACSIDKPDKIILIVLDAVRSDHVGCYGSNNRNLTPNIDSFAKDALRFNTAIVQGEWTLPSFMSMLTGTYPSAHNVYHHSKYHVLDKGIKTLPQVLRNNGFITRSYFTHKRLMSHFGFARGFDSHLFRQCDRDNNIATADDVTDRAIDMLEFHKDDNLFLMLHFFDTHQPCIPPSPYSEIFDKTYKKRILTSMRQKLIDNKDIRITKRDVDNLIARYDAEILHVDLKIGLILDYLKRAGQYENATIIVTADHGMLLGDHLNLTEIKLFDEIVKVPFIIKFPNSQNPEKGLTIDNPIAEANIDIMPTILSCYGINIPDSVQGKSLLKHVTDRKNASKKKNYAISESLFADSYTVSLRDANYRYMYNTKFNISDFRNYKEQDVKESIFRVNDSGPEQPIEGSNAMIEQKQYNQIVRSHIGRALELRGIK